MTIFAVVNSEYKMRLNIIHLPHREDRLILLKSELYEQEISDYTIFDGILDPELPCRGISRAHKHIISIAKMNNDPYVLVGEDDLKFTAKGAFQYYVQNVPVEFDLYLGGIVYGILGDNNTVNDFAGAMLYMVHHRFYDTFLSLPEDEHLDRSLRNKGLFVVCNPMVATQQDGYSDNNKMEMNYGRFFQNRRLFQ